MDTEKQTLFSKIEEEGAQTSKKGKITKIIVCIILVAIIILGIFNFGFLKEQSLNFIEWLTENPILGAFIYMIVYAIATICFVPGSILTLGSGFAFSQATNSVFLGTLIGTVSSWTGASIGAQIAFFISRYILRESFQKMGSKNLKFRAIEKAVSENGLQFVILIRLTPIFPFNFLNYLLGISSISAKDNMKAMIGMIPGTIVYVYIGASLQNLTDISSSGSWSSNISTILLMVIGTILAFVGLIWVSRKAKKEIDKALKEQKEAAGEEEETL